MTDNSPFVGTIGFAPPFGNSGNTFALQPLCLMNEGALCSTFQDAHQIDLEAAIPPAMPDRYILPMGTEDSAMDGLMERLAKAKPNSVSAARRRPQVVIIGAGFGGLMAAKRLKRADADVTVVDRRNHHLFQPLLYQVATAVLSPPTSPRRSAASSRDR